MAEMLSGGNFGGIAIQMQFWAQVFHKNAWSIHALTNRVSFQKEKITFHHISNKQSVNLILEWINAIRLISKIKPKLILIRGAQRALYPVSIIANCFGAKVIFFGASDVNFIPYKAAVGNKINHTLYNRALRNVHFIIAQNDYQKTELFRNYGRNCLIIPNIWDGTSMVKEESSKYDVVWISNFRRLKRAEWVLDLAKLLPNISFAIAGGPNTPDYYELIKSKADLLSNIDFLGPISIAKANSLVNNSKLLLCSSEYEGFPNTFLQAWNASKPVISTVDPNKLLETHKLGIKCDTVEQMAEAIKLLLNNPSEYNSYSERIDNYFTIAHSANAAYNKLLNYIKS